MSTVSLHFDCFACKDCDFQRFKQTPKGDPRWTKMITRLHKKKCPKTGRTKKFNSWNDFAIKTGTAGTTGGACAGYVKNKVILKTGGETIKAAGNSREIQSDIAERNVRKAQEKTSKSV